MTRTTIAALAVGGALTLAACSSHSSSPSATGGTAPAATVVATGSAPSATTAATAPATAPASLAPTSAAAPTSPATVATSSAPTSAATPSIPVTVTSPGSKPIITTKPATPTTSVSPTPGGHCLNAQLALSLKAGSPGAGQIYTSIVFTNTSTVPCTLSGHPGVSYVAGSDGHQVGASATRDVGTVAVITLAPSGTASATLHEANYQNFDPAVCKPVQVEGLRVYPAGSTRSFFLRRLGMQCSATVLPDPAMSIGVVKAGSGS